MTIYFADFDNKLVDALVEAEATDHWQRSNIVSEKIVDAFIEIAGEDRSLTDSEYYDVLIDLAIESGDNWLEASGDRDNRRAILFRMFQKATPILQAIKPPQDDVYIHGEDERSIYNGGILNFDTVMSYLNDPVILQRIKDVLKYKV